MAIQVADIFTSLNRMLEAQEQRERFKVQTAQKGMELAMTKRQQDLENKFLIEDKFIQKTKDLEASVVLEMSDQSKTVFSWFEGSIIDNFFKQVDGQYVFTDKERRKAVEKITSKLGKDKKNLAEAIVSNAILSKQNPGETNYMINIAKLLGHHLTDDRAGERFEQALGEVGILDTSQLQGAGELFKIDLQALIDFDSYHRDIRREREEALRFGDYEFDKLKPEDMFFPKDIDPEQKRRSFQSTEEKREIAGGQSLDAIAVSKDYREQLKTAAALGEEAYNEKLAEIANAEVTALAEGKMQGDLDFGQITYNKETGSFEIAGFEKGEYGLDFYYDPTATGDRQLAQYSDSMNQLNDVLKSLTIEGVEITAKKRRMGDTYAGSITEGFDIRSQVYNDVITDIIEHQQLQLAGSLEHIHKEAEIAELEKVGEDIKTGGPSSYMLHDQAIRNVGSIVRQIPVPDVPE